MVTKKRTPRVADSVVKAIIAGITCQLVYTDKADPPQVSDLLIAGISIRKMDTASFATVVDSYGDCSEPDLAAVIKCDDGVDPVKLSEQIQAAIYLERERREQLTATHIVQRKLISISLRLIMQQMNYAKLPYCFGHEPKLLEIDDSVPPSKAVYGCESGNVALFIHLSEPETAERFKFDNLWVTIKPSDGDTDYLLKNVKEANELYQHYVQTVDGSKT